MSQSSPNSIHLSTFTPLLQTRPLQPVPISRRESTDIGSTTRLSQLEKKCSPLEMSSSDLPSAKAGVKKPPKDSFQKKAPNSVANYNELRDRSFHSMTASPLSPTNSNSDTSSVRFTRRDEAIPPVGGTSSLLPGFLEGPLPSEVRDIIRKSGLDPEKGEEAEREARRLLSTSRRVRVYREELQAAREEMSDAKAECDRHQLVFKALNDEVEEINRRIEELLRDRSICETQLAQVEKVGEFKQKKYLEAEERVNVLRSTIDNISRDSNLGFLMLRQLVPCLNIENYV